MNYWMIVTGPDNFRLTRDLGFAIQGIKSRHRKKAERMRPGDRVVYYLTGVQGFAGTATIRSNYYEDHMPIWRSEKKDEDYPFRFRIEPNVILPEGEYLPAEPLASRLRYVRRWPAEHWRLAFQGNVHLLPEEDFRLVEDALVASASKSRAAQT